MKKLSIEEKAKRYDEAISIAREYDFSLTGVCAGDVIQDIFPELKESEDERIRKVLLNDFKNNHSEYYCEGVNRDMIIAWLEKQGEQKPVKASCLLSWTKKEEKMLQYLEGIVKNYWANAEQEKNEIKIREASEVSFFLKTIQKSPLIWIKCSDALPNKDGIYLVVTDGLHNDVYDMARYDSVEGWHKASEIIYWMPIPQVNNKSVIEQKPAWSDEDEEHIKSLLERLEGMCKKDATFVRTCFAISEDEVWLKSLKDRVLPQPKQEWSEEDELHIRELEGLVKQGRVQPQNTITDEELAQAKKEAYNDALDKLEYHNGEPTFDDGWSAAIDYIQKKYLRPQNRWKPSDEQMERLKGIINSLPHQEVLYSLYKDLKKLKE